MNTTVKSSNKRKRVIVSLILLFSLIMMPVSGALIHINHANEHLSHKWLHLHVLFAVTFTVAGLYHVVYNWRALKFYLTGKNKN